MRNIKNKSGAHACFCIGPQNGEPLCPCRMRYVRIIDGRYVETIDHGPARTTRGGPAAWSFEALLKQIKDRDDNPA